MERPGTPVVFVHGLWLHSESWGAWVERFRDVGYTAMAADWPGDAVTVAETRQHPEWVAGYGINEIVEHHVRLFSTLEEKPIVIGHSFGGLVAQRLLGEGHAAAAVAIDPAPIKGIVYLPFSALRVASVALRNPANRKAAVSLTREQFRYGFGNAISEAESNELFDRWTIPSPGKPLFEDAFANFSRRSPARVNIENATRGPLLLTAGLKDHTIPPAIVRATRRRYRKSPAVTDYQEFPDRGHSLALDGGWHDVADAVLAWLKQHSL
jgi:non-heme chloroperoxidase